MFDARGRDRRHHPCRRHRAPVCPLPAARVLRWAFATKPLHAAMALRTADYAAAPAAGARRRCRQQSTPARPEACRVSHVTRWMTPAVGPLLPLTEHPARTAAASVRPPLAKARRSVTPEGCTAVIQASKLALGHGRTMGRRAWTGAEGTVMTGARASRRARRSPSVGRRLASRARHRRAARRAVTGAGAPAGWCSSSQGAGGPWRTLPRVPVSRRQGPTSLGPSRPPALRGLATAGIPPPSQRGGAGRDQGRPAGP